MRRPILVVEDNDLARKMLRVALKAAGHEVLEAPDARTALAIAGQAAPSLILQDLMLPDMDGLELARSLRQLPGVADVPILALSGFMTKLDEARAASADFTAFLVKPIEPSRLAAIVATFMPAEAAVEPPAGRRILLVDDDPVQLKLTGIQLAKGGFEVVTAQDGFAALDSARRHPPDAIVSDVLMPDLDGFELCRAVRRDPALGGVPVVLVSFHYLEEADLELAWEVGASRLIARAADPEVVRAAILEAIRTVPPRLPPAGGQMARGAHVSRISRQLERQARLNAGLTQRCAMQAAELSILGGAADALARNDDISVALHDVLAGCLDAAGISHGALFVADGDDLLLRQAIGFPPSRHGEVANCFGHPEVLRLVRGCDGAVRIPSAAVPDGVASDLLARAEVAALNLVPLAFAGKVLGALVVGMRDGDLAGGDWDAFLRALASQIGHAIALEAAFAEQRRLQAEVMGSDRMASVGMLAAGLAHDINNSLAAVLLNLDLAALVAGNPDPDSEALREALSGAREAASTVKQIVRDLRVFARCGAGDPPVPVDVADILESALRLARPEIRGARVVRDFAAVPPVAGIASRLGQVFLNLLVNAAQALPEPGAGEIRMATRVEGDRVVVEVADTGRGIAAEDMKKLFTPFFTTKPPGVGTGLGLSICRRIVASLAGEIAVSSEVGAGTTFRVMLPVAQVDEAEGAAAAPLEMCRG